MIIEIINIKHGVDEYLNIQLKLQFSHNYSTQYANYSSSLFVLFYYSTTRWEYDWINGYNDDY